EVAVQAEGVVAPGDVLQTLLHAPVVLGVDDRLLAIVGPRMGSGGRQRGALLARERKQAPASLALSGERVSEILAAPGDDLDLRGDQLAGNRLSQERIARDRGVAQLLKARHEVVRDGVENRELLLDTDGE